MEVLKQVTHVFKFVIIMFLSVGLEKRIDAALFRQLIFNSPFPLIGSAIGSVLVAISLIGSNQNYLVMIWLCLVFATIAIRVWFVHRCQTQIESSGFDPQATYRYAMTIGLSGLAWGVGGFMIKDASPIGMVVTITAIQAMVMGAVLMLGAFIPAFLAFSLPAIFPMIFVLAFSGNMAELVLAIYSSIFLVLMIGIAKRFNQSQRNTWQLTFEKEDLLKSLTDAHDHLALLATSDGLTSLANRRRFDEVLEIEFARLHRSRAPLSLIMLDIDHFKSLNDTYGHVIGDQCLKKVAEVFQRYINRSPELAARYGGEEFAAILPETDYDGAIILAEKIRADVAGMNIPHRASSTASYLTVSMGVATIDCSQTKSPVDAVAIADRLLYKAKSEGRNRIASLNGIEACSERDAVISLIWKDAYACGEPTIDKEHRELFRLANILLENRIKSNVDQSQFDIALDALLTHLTKHFAHEESVLFSLGYEGASAHAERHKSLLESALKLRQQSIETGEGGLGELVEFIFSKVIVHHLLEMDREFFGIFTDSEVATSSNH